MNLRKVKINISIIQYLVKEFKIKESKEMFDLLLMKKKNNKKNKNKNNNRLASSVNFKRSKDMSDFPQYLK